MIPVLGTFAPAMRAGRGAETAGEAGATARRHGSGVTCNSFVPGTRVLMADGSTKPIEDVEVGEKVWATDPETGEEGPRTVTATLTGSGIKHLATLTLTTSDGDTTTLTTTTEHPLWSENQERWIDAGELEHGDRLHTPTDERAEVVATRSSTEVRRVYNLTVAGIHTYHVRAASASILVHNSNCPLDSVTGPSGETLPLPKGAKAVEPAKNGQGWVYDIPEGFDGLSPKVARVRVMDPRTRGKHQYPNGYVVYMNRAGQAVNPISGRTVSKADPYNHIPIS